MTTEPSLADTGDTFRTKTGACIVLEDRLLLARDGARGALAEALFGDSIVRILAMYLVLAIWCAGTCVSLALAGDWVIAWIPGVIAVFLFVHVARSRDLSASNVIPFSAIHEIESKPGTTGATRPRFVVHFDENGRRKRRFIMLPGVLEDGQAEFLRAKAILASRGLLPADA